MKHNKPIKCSPCSPCLTYHAAGTQFIMLLVFNSFAMHPRTQPRTITTIPTRHMACDCTQHNVLLATSGIATPFSTTRQHCHDRSQSSSFTPLPPQMLFIFVAKFFGYGTPFHYRPQPAITHHHTISALHPPALTRRPPLHPLGTAL
jgi:hypothetical protein